MPGALAANTECFCSPENSHKRHTIKYIQNIFFDFFFAGKITVRIFAAWLLSLSKYDRK
jgi:hypothetical protein